MWTRSDPDGEKARCARRGAGRQEVMTRDSCVWRNVELLTFFYTQLEFREGSVVRDTEVK